jgi:hypothetical protein
MCLLPAGAQGAESDNTRKIILLQHPARVARHDPVNSIGYGRPEQQLRALAMIPPGRQYVWQDDFY